MKLKHIAAAMVFASSFGLAACGGGTEQAEQAEPASVPGLSVTNARMVLNPVKGNPAAVYFDLAYDGDRGLTIRKAQVADAKSAMLHDYGEYNYETQMMEALPIGIKKGDKLSFEPGGKHVMAFDVSPEIEPGSTTEVTLTVSGGGTYSFPAEVRAAGEDR
ncbi:copper chaperone PCu(A)C [Altererythrobacter sp.]|uniref:copper chaperone PCu(A)C n=1 Tax=Altererythrobacter sp. TaxID=1872480 RepID=UPI003CFF8757